MLAREALFTGINTFAATTVADDPRYRNQDIVANTLGNGIGNIAGQVLVQSPAMVGVLQNLQQTVKQWLTPSSTGTAANDGFAQYRDTSLLYANGSPFAEQMAFNPTLDLNGENASAPPINTAGESLTNSALTQASGAMGGGSVILGTAPAPAPIVGVSPRAVDQTQTDPGLFESALNWLIPTANAAEFPPLQIRAEYPANGTIVVKSNEPGTVIIGGEGATIAPLTQNPAVQPEVNSLNNQAEQTARQDTMAAQTISERSIMFQTAPNQDASVFVPGVGNMVITDNPTTAGGNPAGHSGGESGHTEENSLLKDLNPGRAVDSGIKLSNALFAQTEGFNFIRSTLYPETSGGIAGSQAANNAVGLPENMRRTRIDNPEFLKAKGFDPSFLGTLSEGFHPGKLGGMLNWADTAFDIGLAYWHYRDNGNTPKFAGEVGNAVTKTVSTTIATTEITVAAALAVPFAIAEWPILATVGIAVGAGYLATIGYDKLFSENISSAFTNAYNDLTK
jgi:hypothetical protein